MPATATLGNPPVQRTEGYAAQTDLRADVVIDVLLQLGEVTVGVAEACLVGQVWIEDVRLAEGELLTQIDDVA